MGPQDARSHSSHAGVALVVGRYPGGFLASAAAHGTHLEVGADKLLEVVDMSGEGCTLAAPWEGRCPCYACADRPGWEEAHA